MAIQKQNFYKWHRILGLTALIPVIFWTLSGLPHPFMSNWSRPTIALQVFKPMPVADSTIKKVSVINYFDNPYYQVSNNKKEVLYFSTTNGRQLPNGDKQYAAYLSHFFRPQATG